MDQNSLKFIIQRFDSYYNASNSKGSFYLAFNTFLCGAFIASYKSLLSLIDLQNLGAIATFNILTISLLVLCFISILLICIAIKPYLTSGNSSKDKYHSLIYFGSVSEYTEEEYVSRASKITDDELKEDLCKQINVLAKGLKGKYNLLSFVSWIIPIKILIIIIIVIIVISR